jgi:hypothetical protein
MTYLRTPIFQGGGGNNDTDAVLIRLLKMFPKRIRRHRNQKCIQKLGKKIISMQAQTNQKLQGKKIEKKNTQDFLFILYLFFFIISFRCPIYYFFFSLHHFLYYYFHTINFKFSLISLLFSHPVTRHSGRIHYYYYYYYYIVLFHFLSLALFPSFAPR